MSIGDDAPAALPLAELECARAELDRLDEALLVLLAKRREAVQQLWLKKRAAGAPLRDPARENALLDAAEARAAELSLPGAAIRRLMIEMLAAMREPVAFDSASVDD